MDWSRTHGRNRTVEVRKDKDMKYPMINKQPRREVNVPQLSGGLNLRDSLTGVRDNQMTDCVNMWYKDGMLRTRPAIGYANSFIGTADNIEKTKIFYDIAKDDAVLVSFCAKTVAGGVNFNFYWQSKTDLIYAGGFREYYYDLDEEVTYFVTEKEGALYCYTGKGNIYKYNCFVENTEWENISADEIYAPIVYHHCLMTKDGYTSTQFEGYNLIGNRYRAIFSTVNRSLFNETISEIPMKYFIPGSEIEQAFDGKVIIAKITYSDKVVEHKVVFENGNNRAYEVEPPEDGDGLVMCALVNNIWFEEWHAPEEGYEYFEVKKLTEEDYIEDNLEITVSYQKKDNAEDKKIFGMSQSVWFGGATNGIKGGSRLFLCGNSVENEKALVVWSGLNNPLYFPENNYVYIGNKAQPVTAFGKQGENLIIFKPDETYYSYYAQNIDITAEDLINQTVVDYEANSVYFPILQLNANIGCDCPETVQLCRNRLVWLNTDGKVYTLVTANQYSEMTIYPVSVMIEQKIKATHSIKELKTATSHDFEGYYVLMIGKDAYVMDYNSYGYTHVYGYTKTEDANCLIPWYYWEFSTQGENVIFYGFKDFIFSFHKQSDSNTLTFCVLSSSGISEFFNKEKIESSLQTKLFDFSAAGYLKNIDRVSIGFGNNGGEPISVSFVTDKGCESETVTLGGNSTYARDAAFVTVKNFYPCMKSVRTFGVKVESDSPLVVEGLSLQYRLLGGVK